MSKRFGVVVTIVLIISLSNAQGFEAFRLKSGMTPDQVRRTYPMYKFGWLNQEHPGTGAAGLFNDEDVFASISFCNNSLVAVIKNIDPDTDFVRYLEDRIREFGQPKVSIRREAWTGTGG